MSKHVKTPAVPGNKTNITGKDVDQQQQRQEAVNITAGDLDRNTSKEQKVDESSTNLKPTIGQLNSTANQNAGTLSKKDASTERLTKGDQVMNVSTPKDKVDVDELMDTREGINSIVPSFDCILIVSS